MEVRNLALLGNPNVGKSTLFNTMTGLSQHTGNWPGKTVMVAEGAFKFRDKNYKLTDLPGCYSLTASTAEEEVARSFVLGDGLDAVIVICDATCLPRNLILALQALSLNANLIICVNLMDEAQKKGIEIDTSKLSELLGVPVIGIVAKNKKSLSPLLEALDGLNGTPPQKRPRPASGYSSEALVEAAASLAETVTTYNKEEPDRFDRKLDRLLTSKSTGFPMMFLLLFVVFWITIVGADYPTDFLFGIFTQLEGYILELAELANIPAFITGPLVLGVYRVLTWVVAVMLPPMAIFFPLFTLLEDLGYLPRVAFNLDRIFKKCSACGKQALTMCMGFGCNAAGVIGCRIIDSPRERLIAIITNNFVPCNGRFPIFIVIISMFFLGTTNGIGGSFLSALLLAGIIVLGVAVTFIVSKLLSLTLLKGEPSTFILELPPYRKPQFGQVIVRGIFDRTLFVLGRAVIVAAPAGLVIWLLANITVGDITLLHQIAAALDPFGRALGMDGVIILAFILGMPANEIVIPIIIMSYMHTGAMIEIEDVAALRALLVDNGWSVTTAISVMLFSLMHWPCSTTALTIRKETGSLKWTAVSFFVPTVVGIIVCFAFASVMRFWG